MLEKYIARIVLSSTASVDDLQSAQLQQETLLRACIERDKSSGNDAYERADYAEALRLYTVALKDVNDIADVTDEIQKIKVGLHSNRAATHMMLGNPLKAAEDCCNALENSSWKRENSVTICPMLVVARRFRSRFPRSE